MPNIVVIEDEPQMKNLIVDVLQESGHMVRDASTGRAGLALLHETPPDLVLCDIGLPEMDGYKILKHVRNDQRTANLPFIFLTALDTREDQRKGMNLGADDYIAKPFTVKELITAVNTRLKKRQMVEDETQVTLRALRSSIMHALPHELRTPLMSVIGYSDIMRQDYADLSLDEIADWSDKIYLAGKRLHRVVENYLLYIQTELVMADAEELAAIRRSITRDAVGIVKTQASEAAERHSRAADLRLEIEPIALGISEDSLRKIVDELVDNAFKFSEPGKRVFIKSMRRPRAYSLLVRDYGYGMTPDQVDQMGAYMQFNRAIFEQQGLGLGFTIAKRLADLHNAQIAVQSAPKQGTLVNVQFPI